MRLPTPCSNPAKLAAQPGHGIGCRGGRGISNRTVARLRPPAGDTALWREALALWRKAAAAYLRPCGECAETSRDLYHSQFGLGGLVQVAELAWQQGVDLYGYNDCTVGGGRGSALLACAVPSDVSVLRCACGLLLLSGRSCVATRRCAAF